MTEPVVGFIGLGKMGQPMALNLMQKGYTVLGYDVVPAAREAFRTKGGEARGSMVEVIGSSDVLFTSLPSPKEVREVYGTGEASDGASAGVSVATHGKAGLIAIDTSTVSPEVNQEVAEALSKRDIGYLGAPVSGGVERAVDATLTVMVGGEKTTYARALPFLQAIGENIFHIGEHPGMGSVVKLTNNYFIGYYTLAVAEALTLAGSVGMDLSQLFEILKVSYGQSRIYERNFKLFIEKDQYEPGFTTKLLLKDLNLARDMAREKGTTLPMMDTLLAMYEKAVQKGYGDLDMAAMYRFVQDQQKND
ncbi:MAG: NAD(P)-dependent oxidoreductase [Candidatus Carbobacillus altaicus]|uniref:3-hydroxyisobutyrate dehydrogenase n=1 Tax=Candidatus Carbonibacillus altaicus TaxID=2163959 RepID=A0A2R6XY59_9BACL|nr:NAD(P)-dependent oxidoreductase [Candidatus Carbobacillus altaicus]PTQ55358.1 MAG: 3-hydroxyisobutyrate dehydrogenase [Candidatus Carbobacillus altaicus]